MCVCLAVGCWVVGGGVGKEVGYRRARRVLERYASGEAKPGSYPDPSW